MMRFELYRKLGLFGWAWRWRLRATNGEIVAHGGQGYCRKIDARAAIDLVRGSLEAPVEEIEP